MAVRRLSRFTLASRNPLNNSRGFSIERDLSLLVFFDARMNPKQTTAAFLLLLAAVLDGAAQQKLWSGNIEITESPDAYSVRIQSPDAAALQARLSGNTLVVESGKLPGGARHTQRIELPEAARNGALQTTPGINELVVGVPKRAPGSPAATPPSNLADVTNVARQLLDASGLLGGEGQDSAGAVRDKVMDQMAALSRQMDSFANDPAFDSGDLFTSMLSQVAPPAAPDPVKAFELQELPESYVLSAPVPEAMAKNISVNVDNDRFVTISARNDSSSGAANSQGARSSTSTRAMTLPGPVHADRLSMDYQNGKVFITLPKK
jgi:HSP20 family molecular chaperone IbpA